MASLPKTRYTPEQYLEIDRMAEHRCEYVNGEILAMAGVSALTINLTVPEKIISQTKGGEDAYGSLRYGGTTRGRQEIHSSVA